MSIEDSQILACFLYHFITFFFQKVRSWSVRTGHDQLWWSGLVLKDLKWLSPLVHYLNSLQKKGCQKSIKQWVFGDPFHIERPGQVLLVPWLMETLNSVIYFVKSESLRHRGRNQRYSFHRLFGHPQGPKGCQKMCHYPLNLDLEVW